MLQYHGGTIIGTSDDAIYNNGSGTITITDGTITAGGGTAVANRSTGAIIVSRRNFKRNRVCRYL